MLYKVIQEAHYKVNKLFFKTLFEWSITVKSLYFPGAQIFLEWERSICLHFVVQELLFFVVFLPFVRDLTLWGCYHYENSEKQTTTQIVIKKIFMCRYMYQ